MINIAGVKNGNPMFIDFKLLFILLIPFSTFLISKNYRNKKIDSQT